MGHSHRKGRSDVQKKQVLWSYLCKLPVCGWSRSTLNFVNKSSAIGIRVIHNNIMYYDNFTPLPTFGGNYATFITFLNPDEG
ncbi:unnamed protein product, partial [Nesidiocoris tenuis]